MWKRYNGGALDATCILCNQADSAGLARQKDSKEMKIIAPPHTHRRTQNQTPGLQELTLALPYGCFATTQPAPSTPMAGIKTGKAFRN